MAKPLPIFRRSIADGWRSLLGWTIGIVGVIALYLPLFPSIGGNGQMQQIIESMPPELVNTLGFEAIGSGAGYTQGTFFGLIGFLLLVIAATSWGSAAIAGAEESGHLELALAHGVGRGQYAFESALSILARLLWLGAVAHALILVLNEPSELELEAGNVVATVAALVGLAFLSATLALAVGALTGRRSIATLAGAGIAVARIRVQCDREPGRGCRTPSGRLAVRVGVPAQPAERGADWAGLLLLWGVSIAFAAVAILALRRRDIVG